MLTVTPSRRPADRVIDSCLCGWVVDCFTGLAATWQKGRHTTPVMSLSLSNHDHGIRMSCFGDGKGAGWGGGGCVRGVEEGRGRGGWMVRGAP